jgi:hypothetical protein
MDFDLPDSAFLYADSKRGVFIPQYFTKSVIRNAVETCRASGVLPLASRAMTRGCHGKA